MITLEVINTADYLLLLLWNRDCCCSVIWRGHCFFLLTGTVLLNAKAAISCRVINLFNLYQYLLLWSNTLLEECDRLVARQ